MSINKKALIERVSLVTGQPKDEDEMLITATLEEIIQSAKLRLRCAPEQRELCLLPISETIEQN